MLIGATGLLGHAAHGRVHGVTEIGWQVLNGASGYWTELLTDVYSTRLNGGQVNCAGAVLPTGLCTARMVGAGALKEASGPLNCATRACARSGRRVDRIGMGRRTCDTRPKDKRERRLCACISLSC